MTKINERSVSKETENKEKNTREIGFSYDKAMNTAPLQAESSSASRFEVQRFPTEKSASVPISRRAILYPIPKVVTPLNGLFACAELWITIVPTNDTSFVFYDKNNCKMSRHERNQKLRTRTISITQIGCLVWPWMLPQTFSRETERPEHGCQ